VSGCQATAGTPSDLRAQHVPGSRKGAWFVRKEDVMRRIECENSTEEVIRSVMKDMRMCSFCARCSWTPREMYAVVREIIRLRAELAMKPIQATQ